MGLHEMADELTREEAIERLGAIYNAALEGEDLEKRLATIPKTLDKYEGKWSRLIKAAEKKYGKPEADESEGKPAKKRGGLFSRRRKPEEEPEATIDEPVEVPEDEPDVGGHEDLIDSEKSKTSLGKAAGISDEGNSEGALEVLKGLISSDGGNPEVWRGLASYFASAGRPGRARACEERADELS